MGGNAFGAKCRRHARAEYFEKSERILNIIQPLLGVRCELIPAYAQKESFGDADILIESDDLSPTWVEELIALFSLTDETISPNKGVVSFVYDELQVDIICASSHYFKSSLEYFSFNDLSNLEGRLTHRMGLKYGHDGLSLTVRPTDRNDQILATVELETDDAKKVLSEILGLPYPPNPQTLEDIFLRVASSKYFDPDIFLLANRNSESRRRDRKRKTYHEFLTWCIVNQHQKKFDWPEKSEVGGYNIREPWFTDIICPRWPWVREKVEQIVHADTVYTAFKAVYNGRIVGELTGLEGKELGQFMSKLTPTLDQTACIDNPALVEIAVRNLLEKCHD